jgi:sporulation protein YlmC with PRC-barrel domain
LRELVVFDAEGRRIGGVSDAVVNLDASQLLLLDVTPMSSFAEEADGFLVPLSALVANKETVRVSYDVEELGFGGPSAYSDSRPDFADDSYHERLADYWNARETRYALGMRVIPVRMTPATFITTFELYTQNRDSQGEIVDVIVQPDGTVDYAVVALEGFFGFGNRRIVAPVSLLTVSPVSNAAVLNVRAADINEVPTYPDGRTIDTTAEGWDDAILSYWNNLFAVEMGDTEIGTIPTVSSAAAIPPGRPIPASAMIGAPVTAAEANARGTIQDLYVDLVDGRVGFATLGIDGIGTIPVPIAAVEREAAGGFVLDANRRRIEEAPGIDAIPLTPNVAFLEEIESYWGGR